ncbi:helicase associated domain-containing protein [Streptomyces sp. NPDC096057]|uniref:helicase associated domain-containing protein n=1 Tax=Streptomyces sp. NPDC096057 TaxID=3155543 RepID=UPI00331EB609
MLYSAHDTAFDEGLAAARAYAAEHGHLLPPATAVGKNGYPLRTWLKNQRAAARQSVQHAERRAASESVASRGSWHPAVSRHSRPSIRVGARSAGTSPGSAASASPSLTSRLAANYPQQ